LLNITIAPNIADLKKTDIRDITAVRADAQEIPDENLSIQENLFYLIQVALPNLKLSDVIVEHDFVFCAHSDPAHSHTSSDPNAIYRAGSVGEYTINDVHFNVRDIANRLGTLLMPSPNTLLSMTCHDMLKAICFSFFATLTITHNKVTFASINKSFKTDKTINVDRLLSNFEKEISFEKLEWIKITEHWLDDTHNINFIHSIGTQSSVTNGFDKVITLLTTNFLSVSGGATHYTQTSPLVVYDNVGTALYVIFAKSNSNSTDYKSFRKLIATLWFDYMNVFTSGRIYKFTIEGTEFDYSNSIGHTNNGNARLYSPVSIHYNIVEDCTEVEAVRN
jgi:hypothetical protein